MIEVVKSKEVAVPEQETAPKIDIPDEDVDHAASELGYAVIKGRSVKDLQTLGKAASAGPVHIGRAWLMMAQSSAQSLFNKLGQIVETADDEGQMVLAVKLQEKVLGSMITAAKTMIESDKEETQGGGRVPTRQTGFGPGVAAVPQFPIQINISESVEPRKNHVKRVDLEPTSGGVNVGSQPSGNPTEPAEENSASLD